MDDNGRPMRNVKVTVPMSLWQQEDGGTPPEVGSAVCVYGKVQSVTNANILINVNGVEPDQDPSHGEQDQDQDENQDDEQQSSSGSINGM